MVLRAIRLCRQCELIVMIFLYAIISSSGMSITGMTTDFSTTGSLTDPLVTSSESPTATKTHTTSQSNNNDFPRIGGSVIMISAAILGSVVASWFARKICPDSWTGKYCHSCRDYFTSVKSRKRRKSAIVLPVDEDSSSVLRWRIDPVPAGGQKVSDDPSNAPSVTKNGTIKDDKISTGSPKPRAKPSFMTIGSLVTTFTVPRSDLTEIAMEQLQKERNVTVKTNKKGGKDASKSEKPTDSKSNTSSEQLAEETNSKDKLIIDSHDTSQEATPPQKEVRGERNEIEGDVYEGQRNRPLQKEDSAEIIHLREITKSVSPSQKSETYSSDFESMTTARTVGSINRMNESPIRTIHEDFKT